MAMDKDKRVIIKIDTEISKTIGIISNKKKQGIAAEVCEIWEAQEKLLKLRKYHGSKEN